MRFLVVEDQAMLRRVLVSGVRAEGHHVDEACDGLDGLAKLETDGYDVVITDINMPNLDGIQMVDAFARDRRDLPIFVACTTEDLDTTQSQRFHAVWRSKPATKAAVSVRLSALDGPCCEHRGG